MKSLLVQAMYVNTPDSNVLRQGDIIRDVYFPRYSLSELRVLHKLNDEGEVLFADGAIVKAEKRFAIVLSQCCEFNDGKRNAFSLGAVRPVSEILGQQRSVGAIVRGFLQSPNSLAVTLAQLVPWPKSASRQMDLNVLRQANRITPSSENKAVNVFLLESDGVFLTEPHIADFSQVVSVNMKALKHVVRSKVLEMEQTHRRQFQLKLGYFYAREAK